MQSRARCALYNSQYHKQIRHDSSRWIVFLHATAFALSLALRAGRRPEMTTHLVVNVSNFKIRSKEFSGSISTQKYVAEKVALLFSCHCLMDTRAHEERIEKASSVPTRIERSRKNQEWLKARKSLPLSQMNECLTRLVTAEFDSPEMKNA